MAEERTGDLVLPQGTFILIQDGANGQVEVIAGPHKASLADTEKPVVYDQRTGRFNKTHAQEATQVCPVASEGQYIILTNPAADENKHPTKGKQGSVELKTGNKVNIPGPKTFALYPGQYAEVIPGHHLKSNEYLVARVYNEETAKANFDSAIVKRRKEGEDADNIKADDLTIGTLFIIKGTDVSFYIPPTGIEVMKDETSSKYVRNAVTLERLEYCILLDQSGDKRYVQGPKVVFPNPTESFIMSNNVSKFRAIELNDNMGIYVKVIADYTEGEISHKAGDELFITGKTLKIYYPRQEHALVKYSSKDGNDTTIHYAVAIPMGEARYVLNKETGSIDLVTGPKMFLPDPRKEVIVNRVLDDRTVQLWFPGNTEALDRNRVLGDAALDFLQNEGSQYSNVAPMYRASNRGYASLQELSSIDSAPDTMSRARGITGSAGEKSIGRSNSFTKPRSITIDSKYDGAVTINVWPGYAVQIVKKTGEREVVIGPKMSLLKYDESLEVLDLSTGKPKNDNKTMKTVYLQTKNNIVSDQVDAETYDSVGIRMQLSYRVNFLDEHKAKWFDVANYVKLMTEHIRSIIRNAVKKVKIETFTLEAADIVRAAVLGTSNEGKRSGRLFEENGMTVYDVEVLEVALGDTEIVELLKDAQKSTVEQNLKLRTLEQEVEFVAKSEELVRTKAEQQEITTKMLNRITLESIAEEGKIQQARQAEEAKGLEAETEMDNVRLGQKKLYSDEEIRIAKEKAEIEIALVEAKMGAVSPGLIEALLTMANVSFTDTLARNLKNQTGALGELYNGKGGFEGFQEVIKGTPLEAVVTDLVKKSARNSTNGIHS